MKYDVVIVGAGPAGIFTALELIKKKPESKIVIVEKGRPIEERKADAVCHNSGKPSCPLVVCVDLSRTVSR